MASLTDKQIDEIVERAIERLTEGRAPDTGELAEIPEQATHVEFEVRSALTGAVVGRGTDSAVVHGHCDQLNAECARDGIRHEGARMRYEVAQVDVPDIIEGEGE